MALQVFHAAGSPLVDVGLVVIHDPSDVGADSILTVVSSAASRTNEVMRHAEIVTSFVSYNLKLH